MEEESEEGGVSELDDPVYPPASPPSSSPSEQKMNYCSFALGRPPVGSGFCPLHLDLPWEGGAGDTLMNDMLLTELIFFLFNYFC